MSSEIILTILIPCITALFLFAVAWGAFTAKTRSLEKRVSNLETIWNDLTKIREDLAYIKGKMDGEEEHKINQLQ